MAAGGGAGLAPAAPARRGVALVVSSPSGAGKTTLTRHLVAADPELELSVSVTTRPPRPGEVHAEHYFFLDDAAFDRMRTEGDLLESATVFGHRYGTPRAFVEARLAAGRDVAFDIDWQGARQLRRTLAGDVVDVYLLPPGRAAQRERLARRGQDSAAAVDRRLAEAVGEIAHWPEYRYVLLNDDLERAQRALAAILAAARLEAGRQPWIGEFVAGF